MSTVPRLRNRALQQITSHQEFRSLGDVTEAELQKGTGAVTSQVPSMPPSLLPLLYPSLCFSLPPLSFRCSTFFSSSLQSSVPLLRNFNIISNILKLGTSKSQREICMLRDKVKKYSHFDISMWVYTKKCQDKKIWKYVTGNVIRAYFWILQFELLSLFTNLYFPLLFPLKRHFQ